MVSFMPPQSPGSWPGNDPSLQAGRRSQATKESKFSLVSGEEGWLHTQARKSQFRAQFPTGPSPTPTHPPISLDQKPDHCPVTHMQTLVPSRQGPYLSRAGGVGDRVGRDTGLCVQA